MFANIEPFKLILSESSSESEDEDEKSQKVEAVVEAVEPNSSGSSPKSVIVDPEQPVLSGSPKSETPSTSSFPTHFIELPKEQFQLCLSSSEESINLKRKRSESSILSLSSEKSSSLSVSEPWDGRDILAQIMVPKRLMSIQELLNMAEEHDKRRRRIEERIFEGETQLIKNAYAIKRFAAEARRTKKKKQKLNFAHGQENFEIKEKDRIFSGTSVSFQPRDIFESDDDDV